MKNKFVTFLTFFISAVLSILFFINLFKDLIFFFTEKGTVANVISITNPGTQMPYRITLKYFNAYLDKDVICTINAKKSFGKKIQEDDRKVLNLNYGKIFPQNIYLADFETPNIGLVFFDIIMVSVMTIFIWLSVRSLLRNRTVL